MEIELTTSRKVLVLALDAASPALLERWSADGTLPNLARLAADGVSGRTRSIEGLYVGATWPSFYTGHDPAGHGVYWTNRLVPGSYRTQRCSADDFARKPALWEVLSDAGRRVVVLDVPLTRLSPRLNGIQVVEWGVHDVMFGFQAAPARLGKEMLERYGPHPAPAACDAPHRTTGEYRAFADALVRGAALRARLTTELLAREEWDFAIQVFSETHCAGHQLWHFHDLEHPGYEDDAARAAGGDLVREVYVAVDTAIGEIVNGLDAATTLLVLALHGMAHSCGGSLLLPDILERLGVMRSESHGDDEQSAAAGPDAETRRTGGDDDSGARPTAGPRRLRRAVLALYRRLPERVRAPLYRARQHANQAWFRRGTPIAIDPASTRGFYVGLGTGAPHSGIRLNVRGREPAGVLSPGADTARFCDELEADLLDIVDTDSGAPLVTRVLRTAELFDGPHVQELPDLLVEWNTEPRRGASVAGTGMGAIWRARSTRIGEIERVNEYCRTGEHRMEGMFIARGSGIAQGRLDRPVSNLDLAPTIARLLDVQTPMMPGTPIPELAVRD